MSDADVEARLISFQERLALEIARNMNPTVIYPGDHLLVRLHPNVTKESYEGVRDTLRERFPDNPVTVINAEDVHVIRRAP